MSIRFELWAGVVLGCLLACGCDNETTEVKGSTPRAVVAPLKPKGPPSVFVAAERNHKFGTMDQQQSATRTFEIRNEGEGELVLRIIDSSCGCAEVKLGDVVWNKKEQEFAPATTVPVQPGGAIDLEVTWNTELRAGPFKTAITIETNDPQQQRAEFTIEGEIVPYIEVSQSNLRFDGARNKEVTTGSVYLYSKKLDDMEITDVESSNPLISAEVEPAPEDYLSATGAKSGLKANVKIEPGLPIGPFNAVLTFKTNSEERPEVSLSVGGIIAGDVLLTPVDRFTFGTVKTTESTTKPLFLKFHTDGNAPVEVKEPRVTLRRVDLRLESDPSSDASAGIEEPNFLKINLEKIDAKANRFRLKVEVPKGAPGGQFRGLIELETDHPTAKLVKIPVSVQVTK